MRSAAPDGVLAFARGDLCCVANLSSAPVALPAHAAVLLASGPLDDGLLPPDTAAWLRTRVPAETRARDGRYDQLVAAQPGHSTEVLL